MDPILTLKLVKPVTKDGQVITQLHIPRPRVKDYRCLEDEALGSNHARMEAFIGSLTGLSADQVGDLDMQDWAAIDKAIAAFFASLRPTGKTQSGG